MKINDVVKIKLNPFIRQGKVGTIIAIAHDSEWPYVVKFPNSQTMSFAAQEIELV